MLGDRIKELREAHGWSQYRLGKDSGLGHPYIQRLERGEAKRPSYETLEKLATAFGITVEELRNGTKKPTDEFPLEELRAQGLPEGEIDGLLGLWEAYPTERQALLESARSLAQAHAKLQSLAARLDGERSNAK